MSTKIEGTSAFAESHDEVNEAFGEVEDALAGLPEKAAAEILLDHWTDPDSRIGVEVKLAFEKFQGEWALVTFIYTDLDDDPSDPPKRTRIVNASVKVKRLAVEKIDELIDAIDQARVDQIVENVEMARKLRRAADRILAAGQTRGE